MKAGVFWIFILGIAMCCVAEAHSYIPIGSPLGISALGQEAFRPAKPETRPILPGMRAVELELLEDALRRKMSISIGDSREKAHASIIRNSLRDRVKQSHINGIMAEALFLKENPQWRYVTKPNAPQVDVYRWRSGQRRPYGAQIKTHASGKASDYAYDMEKRDYRSDLFLVPDDHVTSLREHWRGKIQQYEMAGRTSEAVEARRQFNRVGGLGFTMKRIDDSRVRATRFAILERNASYVSLGAGVAMALGPEIWDWWQGRAPTEDAILRTARAGSILAAERATTSALSRLGPSAPQGGVRGNVIIAMTILATDTAFTLYEQGGPNAFQNEAFYTNLGGGISGLVMWSTVVYSMPLIVANPVVSAVVVFVATTVGYMSGRNVTGRILEAVGPEFLRSAENAAIADAQRGISDSISRLQKD